MFGITNAPINVTSHRLGVVGYAASALYTGVINTINYYSYKADAAYHTTPVQAIKVEI